VWGKKKPGENPGFSFCGVGLGCFAHLVEFDDRHY